jgi:hypothetical protein
MSSDKGKARAPDDEAASQPRPDETQDPSIASRVAASAKGLTRSAFASPNGNELNQSAAAALANSGKGQSSSNTGGSSTWTESSRASQQPIPQAGLSNAFRSSQNEEHIRQSENEFSSFLDGIDSFTPSQTLEVGPQEDLNTSFGEAWTRSQQDSLSIKSSRPAEYKTIAEQEHHDGEDVLALLSSTGDINQHFEAPPDDDENYDWGLTQEQLSELRAMTKDILPPPEPHQAISPENPLNLVPHAEDSEFINAQSQAAVDAWRDQWESVLTRYSDEVWGGLSPLVKEARKEVEALHSSDGPSVQPKALRRLGAILGHLRDY